jgi:hypothetical protein
MVVVTMYVLLVQDMPELLGENGYGYQLFWYSLLGVLVVVGSIFWRSGLFRMFM